MLSSSLGTVVRETSNFLVYENIISSPVASVNIPNLDILTDGGYRLEVAVKAVAGSSDNALQVYVNGDSTTGNYEAQYIQGAMASPSSGNTLFALALGSGKFAVGVFDIQIINSRVFVSGTSFGYYSGTTTNKFAQTVGYTYLPSVSNLNSLLLTAGVNLDSGTTIRLYRKKVGLPSAFPSPTSMLVADYTVPSNTTSVTFSGLNSNLHGGYAFEVLNPVASGYFQLFVNGDNTATNYYSNELDAFSTTVSNNTFNNAYMGHFSNSCILGNILIDGASKFRCISTLNGDYQNSILVMFAMHKTQTITNINSLTFQSATASQILTGTIFRIYRRK